MSSGHHGFNLKHFLHACLIYNAYSLWPASFVFLIYATGAMLLTWNVSMFWIAFAAFMFLTIAEIVMATLAE